MASGVEPYLWAHTMGAASWAVANTTPFSQYSKAILATSKTDKATNPTSGQWNQQPI